MRRESYQNKNYRKGSGFSSNSSRAPFKAEEIICLRRRVKRKCGPKEKRTVKCNKVVVDSSGSLPFKIVVSKNKIVLKRLKKRKKKNKMKKKRKDRDRKSMSGPAKENIFGYLNDSGKWISCVGSRTESLSLNSTLPKFNKRMLFRNGNGKSLGFGGCLVSIGNGNGRSDLMVNVRGIESGRIGSFDKFPRLNSQRVRRHGKNAPLGLHGRMSCRRNGRGRVRRVVTNRLSTEKSRLLSKTVHNFSVGQGKRSVFVHLHPRAAARNNCKQLRQFTHEAWNYVPRSTTHSFQKAIRSTRLIPRQSLLYRPEDGECASSGLSSGLGLGYGMKRSLLKSELEMKFGQRRYVAGSGVAQNHPIPPKRKKKRSNKRFSLEIEPWGVAE